MEWLWVGTIQTCTKKIIMTDAIKAGWSSIVKQAKHKVAEYQFMQRGIFYHNGDIREKV